MLQKIKEIYRVRRSPQCAQAPWPSRIFISPLYWKFPAYPILEILPVGLLGPQPWDFQKSPAQVGLIFNFIQYFIFGNKTCVMNTLFYDCCLLFFCPHLLYTLHTFCCIVPTVRYLLLHFMFFPNGLTGIRKFTTYDFSLTVGVYFNILTKVTLL